MRRHWVAALLFAIAAVQVVTGTDVGQADGSRQVSAGWGLTPVSARLLAGDADRPADGGQEGGLDARLPVNLLADPVFRPDLERMLRRSATFQRQLRRIATSGLTVHLTRDRQARPSCISARTLIRHEEGALASAWVSLDPSADAPRLIAHEMEHVLEQLDGVDLGAHVRTGGAWRSAPGAFETRRAIEAGRRVQRDLDGFPAPLAPTRLRFVAAQRDAHALPASPRTARVSASGRYVVFASSARLIPADTNDWADIYVLDLATRQVTLETPGRDGEAADAWSTGPAISDDGRYLVFESAAGNLTDALRDLGRPQVFVRDRLAGRTWLVSATRQGGPANAASRSAAVSGDGTVVVFESAATDLAAPGGSGEAGAIGIYLVRTLAPGMARVDLPSGTPPASWQSMTPSVDARGRYVAFATRGDLACGTDQDCARRGRDGATNVYLRDTRAETTTLISRGRNGGAADGPSYDPVLSPDGRHLAFVSEAPDLIPGSRTRVAQVYVRDLETGVTELVSRTRGGRPGNGPSLRPSLSGDGGLVAFQSLASDLPCDRSACGTGEADVNLLWDVFLRDRATGMTRRMSGDPDAEWMENSRTPWIDAGGRVLVFGSHHPSGPADTAHDEDLFIVPLASR